MTPQLREKIALLVFCLLIIFGGAILCFYIFAGHSWNITASNIDDTFGSMDDYVTIVFDGTAEGELAKTDAISGNAKEPVSSAEVAQDYIDKGADVIQLDTEDPSLYSQAKVLRAGGKCFGVFYLDKNANINMCKAQLLALKDYELDGVIALVENLDSIKHVDGIDVAIYLGKNTEVLSEQSDADATLSGEDDSDTGAQADADADTDASQGAATDSVKHSTPSQSIADEVLATKSKLSATGEYVGNTLCIPVPEKGFVGAILVSPSNVVSFKTITEL